MRWTLVPHVQPTAQKKCGVIALVKEGLSTQMNAEKLSCNHAIVSKVKKLKRETGDVESKSGSGRKRANTIADRAWLQQRKLTPLFSIICSNL